MSWDFLSEDETKFMRTIMSDLEGMPWAQQILAEMDTNNRPWKMADKAAFFELRFAYALHQSGIAPSYEIDGEGHSKIDFGFHFEGQCWKVELMRLEETLAVMNATHSWTEEDGTQWSKMLLASQHDSIPQSEEGETLKAVQRICQKMERNGRPHKFSIPTYALHVLLVDFRTFLMNGGDIHDQIHVAFGGNYVDSLYRRYWNNNLISGVFSEHTVVNGAVEARDRLHFIGFVTERSYESDIFGQATRFFANPNLLHHEGAHEAIKKWPLTGSCLMTAQV